MDSFLYGIGILFLGSILALLLPDKIKGIIVFIASCASAAFILPVSFNVFFTGNTVSKIISMPQPFGEIRLAADRLSVFFTALISFMSVISSLYAIGYMKHYINSGRTIASHFFFMPVLIISMLLVSIVQNALAFLIVWEIMSLSSFFLLVFENEKEDVFKAGINYMISMHIGVLFLIAGFVILTIYSGSADFSSFRGVFEKNPGLVNVLFLLFFAGFGTKAGFVPFHTWLPRAHPAAPSHISGLMSGVMIKTGIYGILRIINIIPEPTSMMAYLILFIALISGIAGIAYAIPQNNLKKLLAYSSVENIGIIGLGIGSGLLGMINKIPALALLGFSGCFLHILNHSLFKPLLFNSAGGVYHATHTLEIEKLGGLIKVIRWTGIFFLIGSIAISGLPPFNGFISEFLIYWGFLSGMKSGSIALTTSMIAAFTGLALIGAMALLCFTKVFSVVFLGSPRTELHDKPHDISLTMKAALIIQCLFIALIGFMPSFAFKIVSIAGSDFSGQPNLVPDMPDFQGVLTQLMTGLFVFIGISGIVYIIRTLLLRGKVTGFKTWDCGYQAGNARIQYTASSYAAPFISLIKPVMSVKEKILKPNGVFPEKAVYESTVEDKLEYLIINPVLRLLDRFLNLFTWIQSGNMQQYILYGLVFLAAISIWITGK